MESGKKPWLALLLSFIFPGLGQFYVRAFKTGVVLIVLYIISLLLMQFIIGIVMFPIVWIYAMIHAYNKAKVGNN